MNVAFFLSINNNCNGREAYSALSFSFHAMLVAVKTMIEGFPWKS
jgi:hypothetical protein